jgi:hypothetical protein
MPRPRRTPEQEGSREAEPLSLLMRAKVGGFTSWDRVR